jgi:hypothetical protein
MRHGTYSIVALDERTGELGVAVQSHWFSVGPLCAWARAGGGAVATQSQRKNRGGVGRATGWWWRRSTKPGPRTRPRCEPDRGCPRAGRGVAGLAVSPVHREAPPRWRRPSEVPRGLFDTADLTRRRPGIESCLLLPHDRLCASSTRSLGCPDLRWAVRPAVVLSRPAVRAGRCHSPVQLPVTRLDPTTPQFHELRCITNRSGSPTVSAVVARASRLQRGQE